MRISDWSSDVCSSDLPQDVAARAPADDSAVAQLPGGELSPEVVVDDALPATATTEVQAAPTQAELDYATIYGEPPYDPVYADTLPAPAQMPQSYDPWEGLNRRVPPFNNPSHRPRPEERRAGKE